MKIGFFDDYILGMILGDTIVDASSAVAEIPRLGPTISSTASSPASTPTDRGWKRPRAGASAFRWPPCD